MNTKIGLEAISASIRALVEESMALQGETMLSGGCRVGRGRRIQREGMDRLTCQLLLQGAVNHLMLSDSGQTVEGCGDHTDLQMISPSGEVFNGHAGIGNGPLDCRFNSSWLNHGESER